MEKTRYWMMELMQLVPVYMTPNTTTSTSGCAEDEKPDLDLNCGELLCDQEIVEQVLPHAIAPPCICFNTTRARPPARARCCPRTRW